MVETTTDAKIEVLVRSVLEAVDMRLSTVRHEMVALTVEAERRHQEILDSMAAVKRRFEQAQATAAQDDIDQMSRRMEQGTQRMMERVEALHNQNADATMARIVALEAALAELRAAPVAATRAALTADITGPLPRFVAFVEPQIEPAPVDLPAEQPVEEHVAVPTEQPVEEHVDEIDAVTAEAPADDFGEIDIERLTALLSARLENLQLPINVD